MNGGSFLAKYVSGMGRIPQEVRNYLQEFPDQQII